MEAHVHPVLVPEDHILSSVNDAFNSIFVEGEFMGPSNVYGLGAGPGPSAVGVVGDIIEADIQRALDKIRGQDFISGKIQLIRIESN